MSNRATLDDRDEETAPPIKCSSLFKSQKGYPVKRKVIDASGRLGSLYDASTDNLIDRHAVANFYTKLPNKSCICEIFRGDQTRNLMNFLANIGFSEGIRQSIRQGTVTLSGASRLIEYDQPINQNTRFLYYSYKSRKDKLNVEARKANRIVSAPSVSTAADYMITKIKWGIELLCVIQISKNQSVNAIDRLLKNIRQQLKNNTIPLRLDDAERRLINQLVNFAVFGSETCVDDSNTPFSDVLGRVRDWQRNEHFHQPLEYTMQPLRWLYGPQVIAEPIRNPDRIHPKIDRIEAKDQRIENHLKRFSELFQSLPMNMTSAILNQRLKDYQRHYRVLLDAQEDLQTQLKNVMPDVRRKRTEAAVLADIIADPRYRCLQEEELRKFQFDIERLLDKAVLIEKLNNDRIEYINAYDVRYDGKIPTTNEAIDVILKRSFANESDSVILWYSGDRLKREQPDTWEQIHQELISERRKTTQRFKIIYVDFTQCQERLEKFVVVRFPTNSGGNPTTELISERPRARSVSTIPKPSSNSSPSIPKQINRPSTTPISLSKQPSRTPLPVSILKRPVEPSPPLPPPRISKYPTTPIAKPRSPMTEINILLLGETGVGKSTFINAFVNYLRFNTLEQAERGEPVVLIPVSFLLTTGDNFDELVVKFGDVDSNENYEHEGQSVTQHCKSYVFNLNDRIRLRLIDSPGIGDTRGVAQDIKNIDHILTYINTLPHLNAVCLLLKPNASRLNVFFRSCINQLLNYLTPIGYNNIIFCFTNSRSTFYAPGETGRLLREMLNQERLSDIPFQRDNTFCFDSESFRYLAARKSNVEFDDYQKGECKNSWNTSVTESIRLLNFIKTREPYYLDAWQTPRKVVLDISMLARPLMETLRLIIYNWKSNEAKLFFNQMVLNSKPINIEMCTHCAQVSIVEIGPFWITQYQPSPLKNNVNRHDLCRADGKNFLIEVIVQHVFADEPGGIKSERWQNSFHNFLLKCDRIHHYLRQQGPSADDDPFEPILERFIEEEQQISQLRNINSLMNQRVRQVLQSIKQIRQQNRQQLFESNERLSLREVYKLIDELLTIPTVKKQTDNIKTTRQIIVDKNETEIPMNFIQNRTFA